MAAVQRLQHASVPMPPDGHEAARRFYAGALGLLEVEPPKSLRGTMRLAWFRAGPDGHEIHCFAEERLGPSSPDQHVCLQVDDLEAFRHRLLEHDVAVEETIAIPNRPRFFVRDPFGNLIELTQIMGAYDEA